MTRLLVIPAAGRGSRLGGGVPKPLVEIAGRPMLDHLADLHRPFVDRLLVVANPFSIDAIGAWARAHGADVAVQREPTGMLDAILLAAPSIQARRPDRIWITWADQVGVLPATVRRLAVIESDVAAPALIVPTVRRSNPYIHFSRAADGRISGLLQRREGDVMPESGEGDIGLFAMSRATFDEDLAEYAGLGASGAGTGERNFLPFIPWLAARKSVVTFPCSDPMEAVGVNTPADREAIEAWMRARRPA